MKISCSTILGVDLRAVLLLGTLLLSACDTRQEPEQFNGATMGTSYSITLPRLPQNMDRATLQKAFSELLARINGEMSTYDNDSTISRFNRMQNLEWFEVSPEFIEITRTALELSELSEGRYDVSAAPLVDLWGFGKTGIGEDRVPTDGEIDRALERTGYRWLEWRSSPPGIRKRRMDLTINLSSIAKGYGVDVLADYLESLGVKDYLVDIGGELRASGRSHRGDRWRIAVEKPAVDERSVQQVIELDNLGVATSGDYRNYFEKNGIRYSHIIDAKTGKPIRHSLASVTVLAENVMLADGWATMLLLLGEEAGFRLAQERDIAAYFIYSQAAGFETRQTTEFTRLTAGS